MEYNWVSGLSEFQKVENAVVFKGGRCDCRDGHAMRADALRRHGLIVSLVFVALLAIASCQSQPSTRILFIGNSYTFVNGGLDKQLGELAPSIETDRIAFAGYTLEKHWTDGNALQKIREGKWSYVVLQEQSQVPVINQRKFYQFARMFDDEIRRSGAKTIMLMTWERPDSRNLGVTTDGLAAAFKAIGKELGVKAAPAGLAFARSLRAKPNLTLCTADGHPTVEGTYLTACVLYRTIFEINPVEYPHSENNISAETRTYLQQIAADSSGL